MKTRIPFSTLSSLLAIVLIALWSNAGCTSGEYDESSGTGELGYAAHGIAHKRQRILDYLRNRKGYQILSGQESTLWDMPWNSWIPSSRDRYVRNMTGKTPAVFSSDFGDFKNKDLGSDWDVEEKRGHLVEAAAAHADQGQLVMLSYHMCPPDLPTGCSHSQMASFSEHNRYPSWKLDQILQSGTDLNRIHIERIDKLAEHLKELERRGVVVLWRPFHELNRKWFWWGEADQTAGLYRQMHHRLVTHHGIKNLIWIYSVNYWEDAMQHPKRFYPGDSHVDMLGVDIYEEHGHDFSQRIHDEMTDMANWNQPIAITENGRLPSDWWRFRNEQPNWVMWGTWWGYESNWSASDYSQIYHHEDSVSLDRMPRF